MMYLPSLFGEDLFDNWFDDFDRAFYPAKSTAQQKTHGLMRTIRLDQVRTFQDLFLDRMRSLHAKDVLEPLAAGMLSPEITRIIEKEAEAVALSLRSTPERA